MKNPRSSSMAGGFAFRACAREGSIATPPLMLSAQSQNMCDVSAAVAPPPHSVPLGPLNALAVYA